MRSSVSRHYKLTADSPSLVMDRIIQPYVNRTAMSARAVISTATIDRVGDVLVPKGCQTENYDKNPVVLWAHGLEGVGQPIGTSRNPDGNLDVMITDKDVQATCWFSQSSLEAAQIFELIDEGIVRATSVRETPLKTRTRHDPVLGDLLIVEEWDLEEWSWCAVGMNPDAVAKALSRNRLGGHPIVASILKSLTAIAPKPRRYGTGFPVKTNSDRMIRSDADTGDSSSTEQIAYDEDRVSKRPYGAMAVGSVHAMLGAACRWICDALGPLENPRVKEALQASHDSLQQQMQALQELHDESYPNEPVLKDGDEVDDDESMKALLSEDWIAASHVLGLSDQLDELAAATNLWSSQRRVLKSASKKFASLLDQSTSCRNVSEDCRMGQLQQSIEELTELIAGLNAHRRKSA